MEKKIQEVRALRIIFEGEKLADDEKSTPLIFQTLEECGISCECLTLHIDRLAIVVRDSDYEKCGRCLELLKQRQSQLNIFIDRDVMLLCMEGGHFACRGIGMIVSSLTMQNVEIKMHRYLQCRDHFIIAVPMDAVEKARGIIAEIIDAGYRI